MSMIQKTSTLIIRKLLCPPYYEYENILQVMDEKNLVIVKIHEVKNIFPMRHCHDLFGASCGRFP